MPRVEVICSGLHYGQVVQNVLHLINADPPLPFATVADLIDTNWIDNIRKQEASDVRWSNILVRSREDGGLANFVKIINKVGLSFSSRSMPSFAAYVLRLQTDQAGRKGRGRIYVPAINFNSSEDGLFTPAEQTAWENNILQPLRAFFIGPDKQLQLVVESKTQGWNPVTAIQLRAIVGCMRRRQPGVGI